MQDRHRHGDIAGIMFLTALIAMAFVPSVLSEAIRLLPARAERPATVDRMREAVRPASTPPKAPTAHLEMELPSEVSSAPDDESASVAPVAGVRELLTLAAVPLPRPAGAPGLHEPRGPPTPPFSRPVT